MPKFLDDIIAVGGSKVGVGTTTPTAPLHIDGATNSEVLKIEADANPYIRWVENGTNVGFLQFLGDSAYLSNMSNGSFFFRTNNITRMTLDSVGKLGLGTTSPGSKLDVYDSQNPASGDIITSKVYSNGNVAANGNTRTGLDVETNRRGWYNADATSGNFKVSLSNSGARIGASNLIGLKSLATLDVNNVYSGVSAQGSLTALYGKVTTTFTTGSSPVANAYGLRIDAPEVAANSEISTYYGAYVDGGSVSGTLTNKYALVTEADAGNVGIGTTSPSSKLEIRDNTASHQLVSINRFNSDTAALYLGNNSSNNAVISSNNTDLLIGKDQSGTFTQYLKIANGSGDATFAGKVFIGDKGGYETEMPSSSASLHIHEEVSGSGVALGDEAHVVISTGAIDTGAQGYQGSLWFGTSDHPAAGTSGSGGQFVWRNAGIASTSGTADTGTGSATGNLEFYTNNGSSAATKRLEIEAGGTAVFAGNVALSNANSIILSGGMNTAGNFDAAKIRLDSTNTIDTTGFHGMRFATSTADNYGWSFGANRSTNGRGSLRFYEHQNSNAGTERFTLLQDGNVGIGNTNPTAAKLVIREDSGYGLRLEDAAGHYFRVNTGGNTEVRGTVTASSYKISSTTVLQGSADVTLGSAGGTGTISLTTHTSTPFKIENDDTISIGSNTTFAGNVNISEESLYLYNASNNYWRVQNNSSGKLVFKQGTTQRGIWSSGELELTNGLIAGGDVTVGSYARAAQTTLSILTDTGQSSILKFKEDNDNYGFSMGYLGSPNNFVLTRHDNSSTGATVMTIGRGSNNVTFAGSVISTDGTDTTTLSHTGLVLSRSNSYIQSNADNSDTLNIGQSSVRWGHVKVDGADFAVLNGGNERFKIDSSGNTTISGDLNVDGQVIIDTDTGNQPFYITRSGNINESLKITTHDDNVRFESIQDESADNYGGFDFRMDSGTTEPDFVIRKGTAAPLFNLKGNGQATFAGDIRNTNSYQQGTVSVANPALKAVLLAHSTESNSAAIHPYLFNDLANFRKRSGTITYSGLSSNPSDSASDIMFQASAFTCSVSNSVITGSTWTIELKDFPRTLFYGTRIGISFGSVSFSPASMLIQYSTDNGANYTTALTSSVRSEYYHTYVANGGSGDGVNAIKFTLGKYTGADPRVMNIYAYNYDSRGMTEYFLDKAGGALYGNLSMHSSGFSLDGNTITGIDNASEFTDNDSHIMTSAAIKNKIADNDNNFITSSALPTDFVSKANGGTFTGNVSFTGNITANGNITGDHATNIGAINKISTKEIELNNHGNNATLTVADIASSTVRIGRKDTETAGTSNDDGTNVVIENHLTVEGKFTVKGDVVTESTSNTVIKDNIIQLNGAVEGSTPSANTSDIGVVMDRGTSNSVALQWDESVGVFQLVATGSDAGSAALGVIAGGGENSDENVAGGANAAGYQTLYAGKFRALGSAGTSGFTGDGSALTALNGGEITTGTVAVARGGTGATNLNALVQTSGNQTIAGNKTFSGATNIGSNLASNEYSLVTIQGRKSHMFSFDGQSDHTLTLASTSYYQAEVTITAHQTNSGTYNNIFIRGIWSNNYTTHHWDELERVGSMTGNTIAITNGQSGSNTESGELEIVHTNTQGNSFGLFTVNVIEHFGSSTHVIS